jgi:hypothetical protein
MSVERKENFIVTPEKRPVIARAAWRASVRGSS